MTTRTSRTRRFTIWPRGMTLTTEKILIGIYIYLKSALYCNTINELQSIVASSWNQEEVTYNLIKRANQPLFIFDVNKYIVLRHPPFK